MLAPLRSGPSVDDERRQLDAAILQLVCQRNLLAPISCLPPELLACIFSWVTIPYRLENLLLITSICRHWRHVALADPTLWSVLEFNELDMALDFLERSRGSRVDTSLVCGLAAENGLSIPFVLKLLFSSMQRTRILKISCSQQIVDQHAQLFSSSKAPHLYQLHFHGEDSTVRIPNDLFGVYHPNLLHVSLWSASVQWDSPLLHSLYSLDLSRILEAAQPSLSELLVILSACPLLKRLSLNKAGPKFTLGEAEADLPKVKLPYLSSIYIAHSSIGMHKSAARILLSHLALPDNVSIELRCFSAVSIDMATLLPSNLQRWAIKPCLRAKFSSSPWESDFEFILSGPVADLDERQQGPNRESRLKVSVSQNVRDPREVLQNFLSFLSTMSSATCTTLELNFEDFLHDVGVHFWRGLFDITTNLQNLIVRGKDTHSAIIGKTMFEALVEIRTLQPPQSNHSQVPLYSRSANKLTSLDLYGVNVSHPSVLGFLREFLLYRSLTGSGLNELTIHHSRSDFRMDLESLEESYSDVVKVHTEVEDQVDYTIISRNSRMRRRRACASVFTVHDTFF